MVLNSLGIVTVLKPSLGYKQCAEIAREGYQTGKSLHQIVVVERKLADAAALGRGVLVRKPDRAEVRAMNFRRAGRRPIKGEEK